jgi:hypothetical protein
MQLRTVVTVGASALLLAGCGAAAATAGPVASQPGVVASTAAASIGGRTTAPPWNRPSDQAGRVAAAGLSLSPSETLTVHYHAHVDVMVDGLPVTVPAGLGIAGSGIAPLHTHEPDGVVHIEAPSQQTFTLGQLFTEWDVALGPGRLGGYRTGVSGWTVGVWVDGKPFTGDPSQIVLAQHEEIAVAAYRDGNAPAVPAEYAFPSGE